MHGDINPGEIPPDGRWRKPFPGCPENDRQEPDYPWPDSDRWPKNRWPGFPPHPDERPPRIRYT